MDIRKGIASLIPRRDVDAEDVLEQIDSMEEEEVKVNITEEDAAAEESVVEEDTTDEVSAAKQVNVVEDFDELEEETEHIDPPSKPQVTPITIDPEEDDDVEEIFAPDADEEQSESKEEDEQEMDDAKEVSSEEQSEKNVQEAKKMDDAEEVRVSDEVQSEVKQEKKTSVKKKKVIKKNDDYSDLEAEGVTIPAFGEGASYEWDKHEEKVMHISIGDVLVNPLQPRRAFDPVEMEELQNSIDKHGILQPLVIRRFTVKGKKNAYELIAGERRLRAAKALQWDKVPCVVRRDVKSDQSRLVFALIENIQRENLNPIEEGMAFKRLNEDFGLTHDEIGDRIGKSRMSVSNTVRLLQLPAEIQRGVVDGKITMGHARAILMIPDEEKQVRFYKHLIDEGLTVRKTEIRARRVQRHLQVDLDPVRDKGRKRHQYALKYGRPLEERYGFRTDVKYIHDKGQFEVIFRANNEKEIQNLVSSLMGETELPPTDLDSDVIGD